MNMATQINALKKKRDALNNRIRLVQNREVKQKRKDDTRRKILVGSYFLDQAKKDDNYNELVKQLDKFLTRNSERKLFIISTLLVGISSFCFANSFRAFSIFAGSCVEIASMTVSLKLLPTPSNIVLISCCVGTALFKLVETSSYIVPKSSNTLRNPVCPANPYRK